MSVLISIPTNRAVSDNKLSAWLFDQAKTKIEGKLPQLLYSYVQPIDANRNKIVYDFLYNSDHDWLMMLDDDMIPHAPLKQLVEYNKKVISGLTVVRHNGIPSPLIQKRVPGKSGEVRFRTANLKDLDSETPPLIKVDGIGTGCLLIHREVLEKMQPPWFKFEYDEIGEIKLSEDYAFSEKCRKLGYDMWVDSSWSCGHGKYVDLMEINKLMYKAATSEKVKIQSFGDTKEKRKEESFEISKGLKERLKEQEEKNK